MGRASVRDSIERLLQPGDTDRRLEALQELAAVRIPLVAEAVALACELEERGPLAPDLNQVDAALVAALGARTKALAADPAVAAFREPGSPFWPLAALSLGAGTRAYLAVQVGARRLVSLTVLAPELNADRDARDRLLASARSLGLVVHPHVATVLDVSEWHGRVFAATEQVDGQTLKQMVKVSGALGWPLAVRLMREAAQGLRATHRVGVTHGRLLPATLFIDRDDRLKLVDFAPPGSLTPDAAKARDLNDLGATLYELLSGSPLPRPLAGPPPALPGAVPPALYELVCGLIAPPGDTRHIADCSALLDALELASRNDAAPPAPAPVAAARRLMVVDDDPTTLEVGTRMLGSFGYVVDTALSPEDALAKIEREPYDAILTDLNFPGSMSGLDLISHVRTASGDAAIVAMSVSQEPTLWDSALKLGVAGIVAKPLDATELVAVLQRAVLRHRPNLLVIDDSHLARRILKRFFENRGFQVEVAPSVHEAVQFLRRTPPDVVISDLHLGDGTGVDVLQYVHDNLPDLPVILISAQPDAEAVIRAHRLNVFDFMNKSEDPRMLLRSVERIMINQLIASG